MKKTLLLLTFAMFVASGCTGKVAHVQRDDWAPDVKAAINDFMDCYAGTEGAYAVFDCDNTTLIFDVERQLVLHQLESMSFAMTPERLPEVLASLCTPGKWNYEDWIADISAAYRKLYERFGPFSSRGVGAEVQEALSQDPQWQEFSTKMATLYDVFSENEGHIPGCLWILYWFDGMSEQEVYDLALRSNNIYKNRETKERIWTSPAGIESCVGRVTYRFVDGIQVTENTKELWKALKDNGIDIWVCSGSGLQPILAAIDAFGLHDYVTGVQAMTIALDSTGRYVNDYDYEAPGAWLATENGWQADSTRKAGCQPAKEGKVSAIVNAVQPRYGCGPIAGFMDATGDFNFCTEFSSLKLVICFNRATRSVTDGGGLVAETAIYQRDFLGYDLRKANAAGDTFYVLQGREENGLRSFRPSNATLLFGESEEKLFEGERNYAQLDYMKIHEMSTKEALEKFAIETDIPNALGFKYGFTAQYAGYHSR